VIERVSAFKAILTDMDGASLDQTIDSFKRDVHPESELVIWERIASTFAAYLSHNPLQRPEIGFGSTHLLMCGSSYKTTFSSELWTSRWPL